MLHMLDKLILRMQTKHNGKPSFHNGREIEAFFLYKRQTKQTLKI